MTSTTRSKAAPVGSKTPAGGSNKKRKNDENGEEDYELEPPQRETVKMYKDVVDKLKKEHAEWKKQIPDLQKEIEDLESQLAASEETYNEDIGSSGEKINQLTDLVKAKDHKIKALKEKLKSAEEAAKGSGKGLEYERSKDVTDFVQQYTKTSLFRLIKFTHKDSVMDQACKNVYDALPKDSFDEDLPEFTRLYAGVITQELSARRTYVQSQCKEACKGTRNALY
jgi:prefoldin subunit 5